jgi:anti-anti-sigma regulatory factor
MIAESYEDVVKLSGAIRTNVWGTIHTAVSLTLGRHPTGVILDLGDVTEITAEGAETFRDAIKFVEKASARVVVANVPEHVLAVIRQVPEVRSQLPIADTVEQARRSLDLLVEPEDDAPKKRREPPVKPTRTILACLSGDDSDSHLLQMVQEFVDRHPARVVLLYPVLVPRELPLNSPLPEEEERAASTLEQGRKALSSHSTLAEVRLERTRDLPGLIADTSAEVGAAHVLVGVSVRPRLDEESWRALEAVIQRVKSPLVFVRAALPEPPA